MTITLLTFLGAVVIFPAVFFFFGDALLAHVQNTVKKARLDAETGGDRRSGN